MSVSVKDKVLIIIAEQAMLETSEIKLNMSVEDFIEDMTKVFPTLGNDWGVYMPEVKYLSPEPLVNYKDLSLNKLSNVHFVGDALSARGITVSGAQGTYVAENILEHNAI